MAIVAKEIVNVATLLAMDIRIPPYQRPYQWTEKHVSQLFHDLYEAAQKERSEYRLGTIVLHEHEDGRWDLIDGQQRILTLHLLQHVCEAKESIDIVENNSYISKNYRELKRLYGALSSTMQQMFRTYVKENCRVIILVLDNEMEAFQFFDAQNARGKALEAHDLLKAYHLRSMRSEREEVTLSLIEKWEAQKTRELADLFERYLYRIKKWSQQEDAHYFHRDGVELFKGIPMKKQYPYVQYHKAAHLFIEKFNRENNQSLLGIDALIPFQIDQPMLAGRRFFEATFYYLDLKRQVEKITLATIPSSMSPHRGKEETGTRYVRELFQLLLMYYYDRFGIERRNKIIEQMFFSYSYQLRLVNQAVYETSINKYALGKHESLNKQINLFHTIRTAHTPNDVERTILDRLPEKLVAPKYQTEAYKDVRKKVRGEVDGSA